MPYCGRPGCGCCTCQVCHKYEGCVCVLRKRTEDLLHRVPNSLADHHDEDVVFDWISEATDLLEDWKLK